MTRSSRSGNLDSSAPAYVVGAQCLPRPLVAPGEVKGHLRLLRLFHDLRITVEECKDRRIPAHATRLDKAARWRWFVHLAVERFERWVLSLRFVSLEKFISAHVPPSDVWMVWHAYLLNPRCYAEDCERLPVLEQLRLLNMFVVGSINIGKAVQQKPSNARMETWFRETGMPFNPFEAMTVAENKFKQLSCPRCRTNVYVSFTNDDGTGFAEGKFSSMCPLPGCGLKITRDNLAVSKFVRDLSEEDETQERFIAGSLFTPSGKRDTCHAKAIWDQLMRSGHFADLRAATFDERLVRLDRVKEIKEKIGYSLERLKEAISASLANCPATSVTRVLSAYSNGSPFSVDLVDAVVRQSEFTARMDELGWLKSGTFHDTSKQEILEHSVIRYHAFLDLMTVQQNSMLVPTLDIDLIWHTHQLMASRYIVDCETYIGRCVDHELSVTESRLSSAFDDTCRAWQARFQVSYMQCGCPVPDGMSMHKVVQLFRYCMRGRSQLRIDLHPEHLPATHPSAHNALLTFQTVGTGTFGKMDHTHGKRKEARSRSRSPEPPRERVRKKSVRGLPLGPDGAFPLRLPGMPVHFDRAQPSLQRSSPGRATVGLF